MISPTMTTPPAFDRLRHDPSGCIIWTGLLDRNGYGSVRLQTRLWAAHRLAWTLTIGPIPAGLFVLHHCDTPACVNVNHLFLGTQADNIADAKAKGRLATGERGLTCKRGHLKADHYRTYPKGGRGCEECRKVRRAEARA